MQAVAVGISVKINVVRLVVEYYLHVVCTDKRKHSGRPALSYWCANFRTGKASSAIYVGPLPESLYSSKIATANGKRLETSFDIGSDRGSEARRSYYLGGPVAAIRPPLCGAGGGGRLFAVFFLAIRSKYISRWQRGVMFCLFAAESV